MEVEYRKELRHNYMIIAEEDESRLEPYCIKIMEQQRLTGVLPLEQRQMNGRHLFYYDITGMQSMNYFLDKSNLPYDKIKLIINGVLRTLDIAYEFLLPCEDFILKPEFIYLDVISFTPSLCFLSGYHREIKEQLNHLLEYLMNKVDYSDKEAVLLVYQLYAASREESFTTTHLYQVINKERGPQPSALAPSEMINEAVSTGISLKEKTETSEERLILEKIPVMLEKVEREEEKECYPMSTYLLSSFCVVIGGLLLILGFSTGILYNYYGEGIDYSKLAALLLIILCLEGYLFRKIWDRKNKISRILTRSEYIDPRLEPEVSEVKVGRRKPVLAAKLQEEVASSEPMRAAEPDSMLLTEERRGEQEEDYNPTCLLSEISKDSGDLRYCLNPTKESGYQAILLTEYPFFIGKLKTNVDFCLDQKVISRYHAKITREENSYFITDLNSTNGTFVNGQMLKTYEKKEIVLGDEIAFANIPYVFGKQ